MLEGSKSEWGRINIQATCLEEIFIVFRPRLLELFFAEVRVRLRLGETTIFIDLGQLFYHMVVEPNSYFYISITPCNSSEDD